MTYVPGIASVLRKKDLRSRMSEIGQRHPIACFPGTGAKPIIRLARRQWWKNASAEGTKRGWDEGGEGFSRKEFPREKSFRLSPRKRAIAVGREGDKMVKGANRVVSSVLSEFLKGISTLPRFSLLFVYSSQKKRNQRGISSFNLRKKKAK